MTDSQRGFTLLEILVAIVIMVMMTALSLPTLSKFGEGLALKASARTVSTMIQVAQRYAINYDTIYRVDIYPDQNWAAIYSNDTGGELIGKMYRPPSLINIATTTINGTSSSDLVSKGSIKFYGKGTASTSCYIHLVRTNTFFSDTTDPYDMPVADPITYYQPGYNYKDVPDADREKCLTLQVSSNTGRVKLYGYGKGEPWE